MSIKLPAVSIAIPFFNAEHVLKDSIRSVFAQTHQNWELILIDDGSTDRSLEIARSIDDPRVRVYSDGKNMRLASRLNQISTLARYDYIARMDADDLMTTERIERLLSILVSHPEYDLVSCGTYSVDSSLRLLGQRGQDIDEISFSGLLAKTHKFLHAGLVARKCWYLRNKYDESLPIAQDSELWLRASKAGDFKAMTIAEPLYIYREEGNVTKRKLLTAYRLERSHFSTFVGGRATRWVYLAKSAFKTALVVLLDQFGALRVLLDRRHASPPCAQSIAIYEAARDQVLGQYLPGEMSGSDARKLRVSLVPPPHEPSRDLK